MVLDRRKTLWWVCAAGIACVLLLPLTLVPILPVLDYPNHLARMYILAHPENTIVRGFYSPAWGIVPYAVTDAVAVLLQQVFPLLLTGKIMFGAALLAPWAGMIAYHHAVYRRLSWWILSFGVFAYNSLIILCLYNFNISCGAALLFAAVWIWLRPRHSLAGIVLSIPLAAFLFLIHLYGVVFYLLLIGSHELAAFNYKDWRQRGFWQQAFRAALRLLPATVTTAVLEALAHNISTHSATHYFSPGFKLEELAFPWTGYLPGSGAIGLIVWLMLYAGIATKCLRFAPGAAICAAICFTVFLASPFELAGAALFSSRFVMMTAMIVWAGAIPQRLSRTVRNRVALAMACLFAVNIISVSLAWLNEEKDIDALRRVIATVQPGSRVLYVTATDGEIDAYEPHAPFGENLPLFPAYLHFPALLVFEHSAFWPYLLSVRGTMPVRVNPAYTHMAAWQGGPSGYDCLTSAACLADNPGMASWQKDFDYVLLLPVRAVPEAAHIIPDKLSLVAMNSFAALYRINHSN